MTNPEKKPKPVWLSKLQDRYQSGALARRFRESKWTQGLQAKLKNFEPGAAAEWANRTFQKQGVGFYGRLAVVVLCSYFLADLTALLVGRFIPEPPPVRIARTGGPAKKMRTMDDYNIIFVRNLFNSEGKIPGEEEVPGAPIDEGGAPTKTTLPFNLIGTLILRDELRSIATIEDKSASIVYPVRIQDEIPSKAKILKIESDKVIFINTQNGRREFIDLPEGAQSSIPRITLGTPKGSGVGIEATGNNQFNVSRNEVDKTLADLNNVLTQARAVPNFENGVANGYKLFQIVPGSIYDKLGLKNGDVIAGLNGETINDPGKAFELLQQLKTSSHLELQIKRDGRGQTFVYDIR